MKIQLGTALKGMAMGIAEVIPGVSGGTIAFISGIYERLLNSIKAFGPEALAAYRQAGIKGVWKAVDGDFLLFLLGGMAVGVVAGIFGISHLMATVPEVLWAFFFGLIIASTIFVAKQVGRWGLAEIIALLVGTAVAYGITVVSPASGNTALWFVFVSGVLAISALMLPGISGSFILLLLGMYTYIIPLLKDMLSERDLTHLPVVIVFALGCLTGLVSFSRVLSWTFKHYHNPTMALLAGFMLGSLNKIWPWRQATEWVMDPATGSYLLDEEGQRKVLMERNVSPADYLELTGQDPKLALALAALVLGFVLVFAIERFAGENSTKN